MHEYNINIYYWGRSRSSLPRAVYVCSYSLQRPVYNAKNNLTSKYFFFCKTTYYIFSYFFLGIFLIVVFCYKILYLNLLNNIILPLMQFLIIRIQSNNVCLVFTKIHSSFGVSITDKWIYVFTHCTSLTSKTYSTVSHIHTYIFDHLRFASTLNIYIENAQEDQQPYICRVMPHNVYIYGIQATSSSFDSVVKLSGRMCRAPITMSVYFPDQYKYVYGWRGDGWGRGGVCTTFK